MQQQGSCIGPAGDLLLGAASAMGSGHWACLLPPLLPPFPSPPIISLVSLPLVIIPRWPSRLACGAAITERGCPRLSVSRSRDLSLNFPSSLTLSACIYLPFSASRSWHFSCFACRPPSEARWGRAGA